MRKDLHWFLHLCREDGILSPAQIHATLRKIHSQTPLENLAQILIQDGCIENEKAVKGILKNARSKAGHKETPPPLPPAIQSGFTGDVPDFDHWKTLSDEDLRDELLAWIRSCLDLGVSDLHLTSNSRPRVRFHRKIEYLSQTPLDHEIADRMNRALLTTEQEAAFDELWDLDFALPIEEANTDRQLRLRVNLTKQERGISGVYHMVHSGIASLEELGFPATAKIRELLSYHNGMILITGPVGSGKTTTLSCLINELNETRREHIITIADPIEVIQPSKNSIVTQRQVGQHTRSFGEALASALREDPDIIVVGELRDLETIEMAVTAAETGHLVIGTLHTRDAATTLSRIIDVFPPSQQKQIRNMVAESLRGIICQRLLPSTDGGVVLASELMFNTSATANMMREGKESGLRSAMLTGRKLGMRTMDDSIAELYETGRISRETALLHVENEKLPS